MKTLFVSLPLCLTAIVSILGITNPAQAGTIGIPASNSGNYNFNGSTTNPLYSQASASSYVTGRGINPQENRSYFVFTIPSDMSKSSRTILGATLTLANPNASGTGLGTVLGRTLNITNVTSNISQLTSNQSSPGVPLTNAQRQAIFNDLGATGTGNTVYGTTTVRSTTGTSVPITLNQNNILNNIKSSAGSQLALGAAITTLNATNSQNIFIGSTASPTSNRLLTINFADAILGTNGNQQFGNVLIGQSANSTITVTNNGELGSTLTGSIGSSTTSTIQPTAGVVDFSLGANASSTRTFTYTPTQRGINQTNIGILSNDTNSSILLTGTAVAPQNAIIATTPDVGYVRLGTSGTARVTIQNQGNGNLSGLGAISNLNGTSTLSGSSANFLPTAGSLGNLSLRDNVTQNLDFQYTPTTRGPETEVLTLNFSNGSDNGTNQAQTKTVNLAGYGVGPAFQSGPPPDSTLDFGKVGLNTTAMLDLVISNGTEDPTSLDSLTGLTLLDAFFEGPDAKFFSLANFISGTVLSKGESFSLELLFNSNLNGPKNAVLHILTDQGADFGQTGLTFTYNVTAIATPEPSSLLGIGVFVTTGLLLARKRNP